MVTPQSGVVGGATGGGTFNIALQNKLVGNVRMSLDEGANRGQRMVVVKGIKNNNNGGGFSIN